MGIDGRLFYGDGVLINTAHLPENYMQALNYFSNKYPNLLEYNHMNELKDQAIIIWGEEPTYLFPVNTYNRRPLIINSNKHLELMTPTNEGMNLDTTEIWDPSYDDFVVQLNDHTGREHEIRMKTFQYQINRTHEVNPMFFPENIKSAWLSPDEVNALSVILADKRYTLVGKFMVYNAD